MNSIEFLPNPMAAGSLRDVTKGNARGQPELRSDCFKTMTADSPALRLLCAGPDAGDSIGGQT
jgi:hypothetical protein